MKLYFKYRLYPNLKQAEAMLRQIETHRRLYNECLYQRRTAWKCYSLSITYNDQCKWMTAERKKNPFLKELYAQSAQATIKRVDRAFDSFFRSCKSGEKPGYPHFKERGEFNSMVFLQADRGGAQLQKDGKHIRIHGVGDVRVNMHRPTRGRIKSVVIKQEPCGEWYAFFSCEDVPLEPSKEAQGEIGIDVGLTSFATLSNGEKVENPRFLKESLPRLARIQRAMSRKKKFGRNWEKARTRVAKLHAKIKRQREGFTHVESRRIARRYELIAVENLCIEQMQRTLRATRSIWDAGWGRFLSNLEYKAIMAVTKVVRVDPRHTSQICSKCGELVKKDLWVRVHRCPKCGLVLDRDVNAARVILARAQAHAEPVGANGEVPDSRSRESGESRAQLPSDLSIRLGSSSSWV